MVQKKYLKIVLITTLVCISLGGFLLHLGIHPIQKLPANFVPFFAGIISVLVVSTMFCFKKLIPFAYLTNGMLAIIGTITMVHYGLVKHPILPDILILWGVFFIGKLLFDLEMTNTNNLDAPRHKGRFFRYPNMGYWGVHLAALSIVYYLGHILWK